jgi:hypothetical protein
MWLSQFLLGRPGYEIPFDVNPEAMQIDEMPITVLQRNLAGDLKKSLIKVSNPVIKINSSYLAFDQRNDFASLMSVNDSFLSFQTRDDWKVNAYKVSPLTLSTVQLPNTSATRLSTVLASAGFAGVITINTVYAVPNPAAGPAYGEGGFGDGGYSGPDYYSGGGTYNDITRIITLGTPLPSLDPVFVTYTYKGWLVNIESLTHSVQGGWIDRFTYDFQLIGA